MSKGTNIRNFRVADDLWIAAKEKARTEEGNVSDVLRDALVAYTRETRCSA